jgi:hypothetical protein
MAVAASAVSSQVSVSQRRRSFQAPSESATSRCTCGMRVSHTILIHGPLVFVLLPSVSGLLDRYWTCCPDIWSLPQIPLWGLYTVVEMRSILPSSALPVLAIPLFRPADSGARLAVPHQVALEGEEGSMPPARPSLSFSHPRPYTRPRRPSNSAAARKPSRCNQHRHAALNTSRIFVRCCI